MSGIPDPISSVVPSLPDGWYMLRFNVLAGSRLAATGVNADLRAAWQSDREHKTVREAWRAAANAIAKIWIFDGDNQIEAVQFRLLEPFPIVDQFPDGRWLVANSRSHGHGNARIIGADGIEERRIELGDGIEHIKIDDDGRIWVGWFDEGVFGNEDWRVPGLKRAPSVYGISAFDERGTVVRHAPSGAIADCYALNVSADACWACTYPDFPILQIGEERDRTWPTDLRGTRALALSYPYLVAAGGYEAPNRVVLLRLDDLRVELLGEWRWPLAVGGNVSMIDGRDDELHVVVDQEWHRWQVRDFVDVCG